MPLEAVSYFDFHIHGRASSDSWASYPSIFRNAKKHGLSGMAITDHDTTQGYKEIRKLDHYGLIIFDASAEITTKPEAQREKLQLPHILAINIPPAELKSFIKDHPFPKVKNPLKFLGRDAFSKLATTGETLEWISQFPNSLAIAAHPSAEPEGGLTSLSFAQIADFSRARLLDGMEVFNRAPRKKDPQRYKLAQELDIAMLGNSDAHRAKKIGRAATLIPVHPRTPEEVVYQIKNRLSVPVMLDNPEYLSQIQNTAGTIYERMAA